jgi:hypothetical protein
MCFFAAAQAGVATTKVTNQRIETLSLENKSLGTLTITVEAESADEEPAMRATAVVRKGSRVLQRIEIPPGMRFYKQGDSLLKPKDIDNDGNVDFFALWEDSKNAMWVLYRFDVAASQFKHEGDWANPRYDRATRCIVERTQGGHAGAIGGVTVTCRQGERWVKRFHRDQNKYVPHAARDDRCANGHDYHVKQTDWSVRPTRVEKFTLQCDGEMTDRLPAWVARVNARAK